MELTKQYLQEQYNFHESNFCRHQGNVIELTKQFKQLQSEINYETTQMELSQKEVDKFNSLLKEVSPEMFA